MQRTLIIGASGQIGKQVTQLMLDGGHFATALVRDKSKLSDVQGNTLSIVEADLTEDFGHAFEGCTEVIFVAGSGGDTGADKTLLIDLWAACRSADYAKKHAIQHFIMVSSIGADAPSNGPNEMQPYLVAKHMADEHLIRSGLHYTILRPGSLTNDDAKGSFSDERPKDKSEAVITRADVAQALVYLAGDNRQDSMIKELFNGGKTLTEVLR
ncbi:SDR family oxidoreductase [Aliiglaciecola sp. LCG003]|uniref:SDR family oxidoreductase n=1 Tax=Aliiglaciecola sp. LCG003 TaxID=3053655 RepID=UPI002572774B|nr:SDR family oxidoreductase [Aliiglaciecola sp. LCG003]WJG10045.1 SDR family oxidoreductase [Aliiglaciecola sp. LCG003]